MKKVELTALVGGIVLYFCENLAELGCPQKAEPDMWFRYLSPKKQQKVVNKILDIMDRDYEKFKKPSKKR